VDFAGAEIHREAESWYSVGIKSDVEAKEPFSRDYIWLPNQVTFLGLKPTTATAHGKALSKEGKEAPVCFIHRFGRGQALLLNFVYRELNSDTMGWHRLFGEALMRWSGVEPLARIVHPMTRAPLPYRPLYAFRYGKATLLGSIRGKMIWSGASPVLIDQGRALSLEDGARFEWTGKRHVYDVRKREYLGFAESAALDLPSFEGRLLSLLPYNVTALELDAPKRIVPGTVAEVTAKVRTERGAPGDHLFYFEVTSPTGARRPLYCGTRAGEGGKAGIKVPFALNDPEGAWQILARDVLTGSEQTATVRVAGK